VNTIWPPKQIPIEEQLQRAEEAGQNNGLTGDRATPSINPDNSVSSPKTGNGPTESSPVQVTVTESLPEETLVMEDDLVRYTFTSKGGGIKHVELREFDRWISCDDGEIEEAFVDSETDLFTDLAVLNNKAPLPMMSLVGLSVLQGDEGYSLNQNGTTVTAEKRLSNGLKIVKEFIQGTNYEFSVTIRIENDTEAPIQLPDHDLVIGTSTPVGLYKDSLNIGSIWFNGTDDEKILVSTFGDKQFGCVPKEPLEEYVDGAGDVEWVSVHDQFFTITAIPIEPADTMFSQKVSLPPPTLEELKLEPKALRKPVGIQSGFRFESSILAANSSTEFTMDVYAGPRKYKTLSKLGLKLETDLEPVMGFGGFFGFFAKILLLSMNLLHEKLSFSYGFAIIGITVIMKMCFWPLTNASTRSMKRMSALQPQMKEIQEKFKEDPPKMNKKLMAFMKENRINPLGGCFPILLQMPIFFGFFTMLRSAVELRGASFLWVCDLSKSDTIAHIFGFPLNPMPLLMGLTMFYQARLTPPSPGVDPTQQKIMRYMPIMFLFILYNFSSALTLYWTVQNLLSIFQTKITKTGSLAKVAPVVAAKSVAKSEKPKPKKKSSNKRKK